MSEMKIAVKSCAEKPKYQKTAAELLQRCREFYQDEENERAFQEWKTRKEARNEKAV